MKLIYKSLGAGALALLTGVAIGAGSEPQKMYPGDAQPDEMLSLVAAGWVGGPWNKVSSGQIVAYVAGIDGVMCPENEGNGGGVPYCGIFLQMLPGDRTLNVRLSHSAESSPTAFGTRTTFKQNYVDLPVHLEKDTIYRVMPSRASDGGLSVTLQELCKGKPQKDTKVQFVLRDARKDSGPECP